MYNAGHSIIKISRVIVTLEIFSYLCTKFKSRMVTRRKKKQKFIETVNELYDRYWKIVTILVACITGSFWLGTYYEEVKKEREISEMEDRHYMELLNMKEEYMNKYLDMREKILVNKNDSTYGNKKDK